jgi:hypothetical protein
MARKLMVPVLLCVAVGLAVPSTLAQGTVSDAQNKLLAKRAAEADAYRKLAETIRGLHITSETVVRDFVTESDIIETELDTFIKGARFGEPRWYEDLSCEIEAEVTVAKLITHLKELHTRHYQGDTVKGTDFEQMKQTIKKDIIKVVGMGAPRPDLPPGLPEGVEEVLTQVDVTPPPSPPIPELWKDMGPQARMMAKRAAELDALRKLFERIKGLRITSDTRVRDFVTEWDVINTEAKGYLVGARAVKEYYQTDEPICEVTYAIPVEQVITTIKELHHRHYKGDRVTGTDIVNIKKQFKRDTFEATGMGVPPQKYVQVVAAKSEIGYPDWVSTKITVTGQGTDPEIDTPQGKLKAARAAELDAKRKLAEQIHGMQISSDTLVRDFVTEYDEVNAQLDTVLAGAMVDRTNFTDGVCEVTVSVPGMEVWSVLHQQLIIVRRQ